MSEVRIAAEPRTEFGKGHARRVRRANKVPVVLYGHGAEPRHYSLPGHELMLALKHDPNALLALQTPDGEQLALPKSVVRDPMKGSLEHVDLVAVNRGERVTVEVPVTLTGETGADTIVETQQTTVTVETDATSIPDHLEVSIEGMASGEQVTAGDVELPEGVTLAEASEDVLVQTVAAPTEEEVSAELAAAEAELGAGASASATQQSDTVEPGSESDAAGEGDIVGETEAPLSETPDQTPAE